MCHALVLSVVYKIMVFIYEKKEATGLNIVFNQSPTRAQGQKMFFN